MEKKKIVVVLGMHRSGTSAITRGLKVLGVDLGKRLLPAETGINDKGFWEDADVTAFNVELLHALGHDWHTLPPVVQEDFLSPVVAKYRLRAVELLRGKVCEVPIFGVKDPRMARLLPFWRGVFAHLDLDVGYVIAFRNPMNVANSLVRRNGFELEKGYLLWLEHMLNSLRFTQGDERVVVSYDRMLSQPASELQRMATALCVPFDPVGAAFREYQEDFLAADLQHNRYELADLSLDEAVTPQVLRLSTVLDELCRDVRTDDVDLHAEVASLHGTLFEQMPVYRLIGRYDMRCIAQQGEIAILSGIEGEREGAIADLHGKLADRDCDIAAMAACLRDRDVQVADLTGMLADRDCTIVGIRASLLERDAQIAEKDVALSAQLATVEERNLRIVSLDCECAEQSNVAKALRQQGVERDSVIGALRAQHAECEAILSELQQTKAVNVEQISALVGRLAERDQQLAELKASVVLQCESLANLRFALEDKAGQLVSLSASLKNANARGVHLEECLAKFQSGKFLARTLAGRFASRLTRPLVHERLRRNGLFDARYYLSKYEDVRQANIDPFKHFMEQGWREGRHPSEGFSAQAYLERYEDVRLSGLNPIEHYLLYGNREGRLVNHTHGYAYRPDPRRGRLKTFMGLMHAVYREPRMLVSFVREARRGGVQHALEMTAFKLRMCEVPQVVSLPDPIVVKEGHKAAERGCSVCQVVPYYLDPYLVCAPNAGQKRIAVHLHLSDEAMLSHYAARLGNIPKVFDLYVSIAQNVDAIACSDCLSNTIKNLGELNLEKVPGRGGATAPLIVQFGKKLSVYDYIGHFHTHQTPDDAVSTDSGASVIDRLCHSPNEISQIFALLEADGEVVYAHEGHVGEPDAGENLAPSQMDDVSGLIELPKGVMFWAKADNLQSFLDVPLDFQDFPENSVKCDGGEFPWLIPVRVAHHGGRHYRIESSGIEDGQLQYYELQQDYSSKIVHDTIKVLAYYLPQFHPTPENDEWHGEGFTEWYKVRSANPLFRGHFQQHVPHPDIGYYHLESPRQLEQQADLMLKAGVHGLIYYHYWFSGRMILENPAQMLLANLHIEMPFCFCWANENWTRRWDGNEREILLGQVYSKEDAVGFIRYLIPFFKDSRYVKIDGRPLLFVYRPSSVEHCDDYMITWREECEREGVQAPYVVATLTRGAKSPQDYGMDAAVERVLHDWTDGEVPDIRAQLESYWPLNGSVLNYSAVADHYIDKVLIPDYPLFRSLVPTWDNTARYGSEAYVLHDFTTAKMQDWMESLIRYSERHLPEDRRFVVVNAWNEWAEGAHLEPDTRFGYGYLNVIGRSLCGYSFSAFDYVDIPHNLVISIELGGAARNRLVTESDTARKFVRCLARSGIHSRCAVFVQDPVLAEALAAHGLGNLMAEKRDADFVLMFSDLYLMSVQTIENMVKMARRHQGFAISACVRNDPDSVQGSDLVNFEIRSAQRSGMEIFPVSRPLGYKICGESDCFRLGEEARTVSQETVSTIVRFHRQANRRLLFGALLSLIAQEGCVVRPCLALQDMTDAEVDALESDLKLLPWSFGCEPVIYRYFSTEENPDLRSQMLNETLMAVKTGFVGFLDYDDILFPHAYRTLLGQLRVSGKNATFGRVYTTNVDSAIGCIVSRTRTYEYGYTHAEFVGHNHAPLHSFLLDLNKCDLGKVRYFKDMKYMEDYYLTLQLFTAEGTDWASLHCGNFIGDYVHRLGGVDHTLAVSNQDERDALLRNHHYVLCEARINELRSRVR